MTPPTIVFLHCEIWPKSKKITGQFRLVNCYGLHQRQLIWNLRMHNWKRKTIFQTIIFRSDINLRGCRTKMFKNKTLQLHTDFLITLSSEHIFLIEGNHFHQDDSNPLQLFGARFCNWLGRRCLRWAMIWEFSPFRWCSRRGFLGIIIHKCLLYRAYIRNSPIGV